MAGRSAAPEVRRLWLRGRCSAPLLSSGEPFPSLEVPDGNWAVFRLRLQAQTWEPSWGTTRCMTSLYLSGDRSPPTENPAQEPAATAGALWTAGRRLRVWRPARAGRRARPSPQLNPAHRLKGNGESMPWLSAAKSRRGQLRHGPLGCPCQRRATRDTSNALGIAAKNVQHSCGEGVLGLMKRRTWMAMATAPWLVPTAARPQDREPQALLFGTIFRDSYLALPGARVVAFAEANPRKKYRAVTNYRGEYRIRLPAGDASYVVSASAPKFSEARRTVQVYGMEKTTANLILQPRKRARKADERTRSK